jgi:hypothetical protein
MLAAVAKRQHGVVSARQLTGELGYSEDGVTRAARAGRLHPLHRGVYAVGHTNLSLHGTCMAAVLACGEGALLSHYSAGWLWGISKGSPVPIHVTTPIPRRLHLPVRRHHSRILELEDHVVIAEIPVTALPRTLLDFAAIVRFGRLRRLIERSEELEIFDLSPIEALLARSGGHRGAKPLSRAVALYRPAAISRSDLEREFLALVLESGLPRPSTNYVERGFELDVYWPEHRFAVELDVFETHGTREAFERDRLRQEELLLAGVELIRVTGPRLEREPTLVIEHVARLLNQRSRVALRRRAENLPSN